MEPITITKRTTFSGVSAYDSWTKMEVFTVQVSKELLLEIAKILKEAE